MAVTSRMLKDLAIDVPVNVLFEMPTIEGLAAYIDQGGHADDVKNRLQSGKHPPFVRLPARPRIWHHVQQTGRTNAGVQDSCV